MFFVCSIAQGDFLQGCVFASGFPYLKNSEVLEEIFDICNCPRDARVDCVGMIE